MSTSDPQRPTISIVTACYNSAPFLDRIHASLKAQTYRNFEWICVDDCSTDETVDRLLALEPPGDLGMQVYRLPQNTGGPVAWAVGVARAKGEIVSWLDHDDELFPFALDEIATAWPTIAEDDYLAALFFQALDPKTHSTIGGDLSDRRPMTMQQFTHRYPAANDGTWAVKRKPLAEVEMVHSQENVALGGVILNDLTRTTRLLIADAPPVRFYHRDNPESQTRSIKISRKTVWTYARLLDQWTPSYWRHLGRWIRHAATMNRFARHVHGDWWAGSRQIERPLVRAFAMATMPLSWLVDRRRARPTVIHFKRFEPEWADELKDLRA